jgi:hypothetical protein
MFSNAEAAISGKQLLSSNRAPQMAQERAIGF